MKEILFVLALVGAWLLLQLVVLPYFGIST
jgi:hypothetical protein